MKSLKLFRSSIIIICLHLVVVVYFSLVLSSDVQIPMHWNYSGEVDSFSGKWAGLISGFGINLGLLFFMLFFPYISPWYQRNRERYENYLPALSIILCSLLGLLHTYSLWLSKNPNQETQYNLSTLIAGFLIILIGNIMPKTPKNFFIGIKTPWSLSSDDIWYKTHRLGGKSFILAGISMLAKSIWLECSSYQMILTISSFIFFLIPVIYSFYLFQKERRHDKEGE